MYSIEHEGVAPLMNSPLLLPLCSLRTTSKKPCLPQEDFAPQIGKHNEITKNIFPTRFSARGPHSLNIDVPPTANHRCLPREAWASQGDIHSTRGTGHMGATAYGVSYEPDTVFIPRARRSHCGDTLLMHNAGAGGFATSSRAASKMP